MKSHIVHYIYGWWGFKNEKFTDATLEGGSLLKSHEFKSILPFQPATLYLQL